MNTRPDSHQTNQTRRLRAVRLVLWFCALFTAACLIVPGVEYALSSRPTVTALSKGAASAMPSPLPPDASSGEELRIDLNRASLEDLQRLPGIGPKSAQAILERRAQAGPYHFPEELMDLPGIGQKRFQLLRDLVTCGP